MLALIDAEELGRFQRDADAITRLCTRGLVTESQTVAAYRRLAKRMEQATGSAGEDGL